MNGRLDRCSKQKLLAFGKTNGSDLEEFCIRLCKSISIFLYFCIRVVTIVYQSLYFCIRLYTNSLPKFPRKCQNSWKRDILVATVQSLSRDENISLDTLSDTHSRDPLSVTFVTNLLLDLMRSSDILNHTLQQQILISGMHIISTNWKLINDGRLRSKKTQRIQFLRNLCSCLRTLAFKRLDLCWKNLLSIGGSGLKIYSILEGRGRFFLFPDTSCSYFLISC